MDARPRVEPTGSATADEVAAMLDELRRQGARITRPRRVVVEALVAHRERHLSTEDLAAEIHRHHPDVHVSTVYRTLEFLEDAGLIHHVHLAHRPVAHHLAHDEHQHAVCDVCHQAFDVPAALFDDIVTRLAHDHGFRVRLGHVTLGGTCHHCSPT